MAGGCIVHSLNVPVTVPGFIWSIWKIIYTWMTFDRLHIFTHLLPVRHLLCPLSSLMTFNMASYFREWLSSMATGTVSLGERRVNEVLCAPQLRCHDYQVLLLLLLPRLRAEWSWWRIATRRTTLTPSITLIVPTTCIPPMCTSGSFPEAPPTPITDHLWRSVWPGAACLVLVKLILYSPHHKSESGAVSSCQVRVDKEHGGNAAKWAFLIDGIYVWD